MAYNEELEYKIDQILEEGSPLPKKKMFGGLGYMFAGNFCFGIYQDSLIIRSSIERAIDLQKTDGFYPFDVTGKPMRGWSLASAEIWESDENGSGHSLSSLMEECKNFSKTLTAK